MYGWPKSDHIVELFHSEDEVFSLWWHDSDIKRWDVSFIIQRGDGHTTDGNSWQLEAWVGWWHESDLSVYLRLWCLYSILSQESFCIQNDQLGRGCPGVQGYYLWHLSIYCISEGRSTNHSTFYGCQSLIVLVHTLGDVGLSVCIFDELWDVIICLMEDIITAAMQCCLILYLNK